MIEQTENTPGDDSYKDMHWKKLESLMIAEGQAWVDKAHAVAYLTGVDGASDSSSAPSDSNHDDENSADGTDESTDDTGEISGEAGDDDIVTDDDLVDSPIDPEDKEPVFDPDEAHGKISGRSNAIYWQNGCHFDNRGKYIKPEDVT